MPFTKTASLILGVTLSLTMMTSYAADKPNATHDQTFRVTLLGTGTPAPQISRGGNSTLVEAGKQKLVFDFGRNATTRLNQLHVPIGAINSFFLTHFHSDHTVGLPDLWLTGWLQPAYGRRAVPMELYGPVGTVALADGLKQAFATDIATRVKDEKTPLDGVQIHAHDTQPGLVYEKDGVKVIAFNNDHGENIKPSFGYRIEYRGRVAVLSGDTRYSPEVVKQAKGADLLVHCVSYTSDELMKSNPGYKAISGHLSSPDDAARVFNEAQPKLAVFSHIGLNGDVSVADIALKVHEQYNGNFVVGEDLMSFDIPTQPGKSGIAVWQTSNK
jgi:ribonuclease Z